MTLVLAAGCMLDVDPATMIDAAAAAGFDGVGLRLSSGPEHPHHVSDPLTIRALAERHGLVVHDAEVHRIGGGDDPALLVERAVAAGAANVLVVSDTRHRSDTVAGIAAVIERAEPHGLRVAVEYMAWTDPAGPLDAITVAQATGCVIVVDLLHHHRVGAGSAELRAVVESGHLGWIQLCDAGAAVPGDLLHEARHDRLVPGAGALPLAELLVGVGAEVTISVEVQADALLTVDPFRRAVILHDAARATLRRSARDHGPSNTG